VRRNAVELRGEQPRDCRGNDNAGRHAKRREARTLPDDRACHVARSRAEREAYAELLSAPCGGIGDDAVDGHPQRHIPDAIGIELQCSTPSTRDGQAMRAES
jgi:hypothetical protein